jgi:hypothetical protein
LLAAVAAGLLIFELLPAPRVLYSAVPPATVRTIAEDPRPVRVLNLPFGIRDGLTSEGNFSSLYQFHQTFHEKALIGGYLSRLPRARLGEYRRSSTMRALMQLSEGGTITDEERVRAFERAPAAAVRFQIGWVMMERSRTSPQLAAFARDVFKLRFVGSSEGFDLYEVPLSEADK